MAGAALLALAALSVSGCGVEGGGGGDLLNLSALDLRPDSTGEARERTLSRAAPAASLALIKSSTLCHWAGSQASHIEQG